MNLISILKDYWGVIAGIFGFFFAWAKFTATKTYATKDDLNQIDTRLTAVEQSVKGLATQKDMHEMMIRIERITGKIDQIEAISTRMERTVQRQEEFLMSGGRK